MTPFPIPALRELLSPTPDPGRIAALLTSLSSDDVADLTTVLRYHGLLGCVHRLPLRYGIALPSPLGEEAAEVHRQNRVRFVIAGTIFSQVSDALSKSLVDHFLLKGMALIDPIYGDPGFRGMCDIDLMIRENDRSLADAAMRSCGFAGPNQREWVYDHRFRQHHHYEKAHPVVRQLVEMHWRLPGLWGSNEEHRLIWRHLTPSPSVATTSKAKTLRLEASFFSVLVHSVAQPFQLSIKSLVDVVWLLHAMNGVRNDGVLCELATATGTVSACCLGLLITARLFGSTDAAHLAVLLGRRLGTSRFKALGLMAESDYLFRPSHGREGRWRTYLISCWLGDRAIDKARVAEKVVCAKAHLMGLRI